MSELIGSASRIEGLVEAMGLPGSLHFRGLDWWDRVQDAQCFRIQIWAEKASSQICLGNRYCHYLCQASIAGFRPSGSKWKLTPSGNRRKNEVCA